MVVSGGDNLHLAITQQQPQTVSTAAHQAASVGRIELRHHLVLSLCLSLSYWAHSGREKAVWEVRCVGGDTLWCLRLCPESLHTNREWSGVMLVLEDPLLSSYSAVCLDWQADLVQEISLHFWQLVAVTSSQLVLCFQTTLWCRWWRHFQQVPCRPEKGAEDQVQPSSASYIAAVVAFFFILLPAQMFWDMKAKELEIVCLLHTSPLDDQGFQCVMPPPKVRNDFVLATLRTRS